HDPLTRPLVADRTPLQKTRAPHRALAGIVSAGALAALVAACSSPAAGQPAGAATVLASRPTPPQQTQTSDPAGSLAVSTPVAPEGSLGSSTATGPSAPPARPGQDGVTQRHTFAPSSITLAPRRGTAARAAIQTIDTTASGELSLPADPGQVGWWQSGALAGDAFGSVVLAGHIDSHDRGIGFFARLQRVQPDDEVMLSDGAYQLRYRVVSTRNVPKASLATSTDTFSQKVSGRLVLLTCTGTWDPSTHYPDNLVVTAEPIGDATPRG
ncbi:MAG: class F sortase, partial [Lapillicoccus sp.]